MINTKECTLLNVEVSDECRHFAGILDPYNNYSFTRVFAILIDTETGNQLKSMGWAVRFKKFSGSSCASNHCLLYVNIDYEYCQPSVELVINNQTIELDEKTIGCLDKMDIVFSNITISSGKPCQSMQNEVNTMAYLKSLKAYAT